MVIFKYIGCTIQKLDERKRAHYCSAFTHKKKNYFYRAIRKYGWENFQWEIIYESTDHADLLEKEMFYIKEYKTYKNLGYNETAGGRGVIGWKHSSETKKKISESSKGKNIGKKRSETTKEKIGKRCRGKSYEELYGKEKSVELKNKLSKPYTEKYSEEKIEKIKKLQSLNSIKNTEKRIKAIRDNYKYRLDESGKRIDLTEEGREKMSYSKKGNKNPNFVNIDENTQQKIINDYKSNNYILSQNLCQKYNLSEYLIMRILKSKDQYVKKRT